MSLSLLVQLKTMEPIMNPNKPKADHPKTHNTCQEATAEYAVLT